MEFELLSAGDVDPRAPDMSFTGEDQFVIIFGRGLERFVYIVEANGTLHYVGGVTRNETPMESIIREMEEEAGDGA